MGDEKSPAFQWYPKDFLSSSTVIRMTPTERGIYITLLSVSWLEAGLPDDVAHLAKLAGVPLKQFAKIWPHNLASCFALVKNGRLVNERLEVEREKQATFRVRQAENARRRGSKVADPPASQIEPSHSQASARALQTGDGNGNAVVRSSEEGPGETAPLDVWLRQLQADYPQARVTRGHRTEQAFARQMLGFVSGPVLGWSRLQENLTANLTSHEWRVKGMIPKLENYLADGLWLNVLPANPPAGEQLRPSTQRAFGGGAAFIAQGKVPRGA